MLLVRREYGSAGGQAIARQSYSKTGSAHPSSSTVQSAFKASEGSELLLGFSSFLSKKIASQGIRLLAELDIAMTGRSMTIQIAISETFACE